MPVSQALSGLLPVLPFSPDKTTLPALVHYAGFTLHLLLMNTLVGGSFVLLCRRLFNGRRAPQNDLNPQLAASLPKLLAFTVNFGVVPLLFIQVLYGSFIYPSAILMGTWWLSIAFIVMLAYYGLYITASPSLKKGAGTLALLVTVGLLCVTMFLFVNLLTLVQRPGLWTAYATHVNGTFLNLADPQLLPRYLHILVSCAAVGGLALAAYAAYCLTRLVKKQAPAEALLPYTHNIRTGLHWYTHATFAQVAVGSWFFMSLPRDVMPFFMGQHIPATVALTLSICASLASLITAKKQRVCATVVLCLITVFGMTLARSYLRLFMLETVATPEPLAPLHSSVWFFGGSLLFAILCGVVLFRLLQPGRAEISGTPLFSETPGTCDSSVSSLKEEKTS